MKHLSRIIAWVLVLSLCCGLGLTAVSADTNMNYFFNPTVATAENDLFVYEGNIVTEEPDPATLDPSRGTHYYAGNGNFSRYSSAHVVRSGFDGEEPVVYDSYGTPYYVGAAHNILEDRGLYVDDYYMDGKNIQEKCYARWDYIQTFVLADSRTGKLSTAYCADQLTAAVADNYYNIENLEDALYYTPAQARKVRTVALNGYWGQPSGTGSLAALREKLAAAGFSAAELSKLTDGVAMTATQYAIWHFTNNNTGDKRISAYYTTESGDILRVNADQKESVDLIFKVYDYLINLDPASVVNTTANTVITRNNFLTNIGITNAALIADHENNLDTNSDNDAYTADVVFTMGVMPKSTVGDDLVAQIVDSNGNVLAQGRISGTLQDGETMLAGQNGTYTFEDLTLIEGTQQLKVQLKGHQQLEQGVYLYTHEDGYEASQTLVGIAEGTHTLDVALGWNLKFSVEEPPERIINIHKQTPSGLVLPGIQFDFYCVADREDYLTGKVDLPTTGSAYIAANGLPTIPDYTIITDENGNGTFNLTENHLPDGVYLVVEHDHPAIVAPVDPFFVVIPGTTEDGTSLVYQIDITPKNDVRGNVTIEKDVIELGNDLSNQDAYAPHTWIISTTIPADIGIGKYFTISDTLDNRLDFLGNVRVRVENANGSIVSAVLVEGTDYVLNVTDNDSLADGKPSDSFTLSLTRTGMEKVASAATTGITNIRVYFDAQINANAAMAERIPNQASLDYVNSLGVGFSPVSDIPEVYTGGALLNKVDSNDHNVTLAGAEFKVYRKATESEVADDSIVKEHIGDMVEPMVAVRFFNNAALTGEKTDTAVSDADGNIYVYGLTDGTYYLVETKAPAGYNLMTDPVEILINAESHTTEKAVVIENTSGAVLPETGGMGVTVFIVPGLLLVCLAAVMLIVKKYKVQ